MSNVYTPLQYGWDVVYWLRVEGVPRVWIERSTSLTLPTWALDGQDASLVVDVTAPIGSEVEYGETVGKALRLSWRLRDSAAARSYFATPSVVTRLDENLTPSETSVDVDDASGLSVGDDLHVGPERMRITGIAGNTLTVLRNSAFVYPHRVGELATDEPRYWRGPRSGSTPTRSTRLSTCPARRSRTTPTSSGSARSTTARAASRARSSGRP